MVVEGICEPYDPGGVASYAALIRAGGVKLKVVSGLLGIGRGTSSSAAKLRAVAESLEWLVECGLNLRRTAVLCSSALVVNWLNGRWEINEGSLGYPNYRRTVGVAQHFSDLSYILVDPRLCDEVYEICCHKYEEYCLVNSLPVKYREAS